jgi:ABC-type multidrug transport system fused ATPase/permease subunit
VQDALDQIMVNKSSISIAHRLDTIKNSKLIYVFDKGRVAECGAYEELMAKKGYFYNL